MCVRPRLLILLWTGYEQLAFGHEGTRAMQYLSNLSVYFRHHLLDLGHNLIPRHIHRIPRPFRGNRNF
jgi:hypothetical protein